MKNPKRVAAGRTNRAKRGPLTDATRAKLSRAAKLNQPWRFSTGPKTPEGKRVVAANSRKQAANVDAIAPSVQVRAATLLRELSHLRETGYVAPESMQLRTGGDIAGQLQSILAEVQQSLIRDQAASLMEF